MWQKGQSGNPGGKRKDAAARTLEAMAGKHTQRNLQILADIAADTSQPGATRVAAIAQMLDRGHGKAPQTVNANVKGQYWIADAPITADEWAFEFAPKPDETSIQ